jgi:hypothetical protein
VSNAHFIFTAWVGLLAACEGNEPQMWAVIGIGLRLIFRDFFPLGSAATRNIIGFVSGKGVEGRGGSLIKGGRREEGEGPLGTIVQKAAMARAVLLHIAACIMQGSRDRMDLLPGSRIKRGH